MTVNIWFLKHFQAALPTTNAAVIAIDALDDVLPASALPQPGLQDSSVMFHPLPRLCFRRSVKLLAIMSKVPGTAVAKPGWRLVGDTSLISGYLRVRFVNMMRCLIVQCFTGSGNRSGCKVLASLCFPNFGRWG